jgi:hypothetical protein
MLVLTDQMTGATAPVDQIGAAIGVRGIARG